MTDAPEWELLHKSHWDTTERLAIPGGWLVRSVWRKHLDVGQPHLDGSAVVFVPMTDDTDLQQRKAAAGDATTWPEPDSAGISPVELMTDDIEERRSAFKALRDAAHAPKEPTNAQAEEGDEAESAEVGGEPEQVGLAGQDHGPRRRRPGK